MGTKIPNRRVQGPALWSLQSVLIEIVATPEVSADWSIAQKNSSSSSISINNGGYYDINNEPLLGTHTLRMGMQEVRKI